MTNDANKLNATINEIADSISAIAHLGQDGFSVPLVTTPDELAQMTDLPVKPKHLLSDDLLWYISLRLIICAQGMLEQSARIFDQLDDEQWVKKTEFIIDSINQHFNPCETAIEVYRRMLCGSTFKNTLD